MFNHQFQENYEIELDIFLKFDTKFREIIIINFKKISIHTQLKKQLE